MEKEIKLTSPTAKNDGDPVQIFIDYLKTERSCGETDSPSIFKVSSLLRDLSPSSFEPRMVSIGPLHINNSKVQEFGLKESYLHDLFHSSVPDSAREQTLKACFQKVNASIHRIRASYTGTVIPDKVDLTKMMVMDGCFIIEFCFKHYKDNKQQLPNKMQTLCIAIDLMLVENQIPFFVLQYIFELTMKNKTKKPLTKILHEVLVIYFHPFTTPLPYIVTNPEPDHILGFFHKCYQITDPEPTNLKDGMPTRPEDTKTSKNSEPAVHSVVELDRSGVNFKPHTKSKNPTNIGEQKIWPMTMIFKSYVFGCFPLSWGKPTLLMPTLVIDDISELIFRNLIAYEQCLPQADHYSFTSYAYAMDKLIDTHEDVSKLVESKVLINRLGSNEEAAHMINKICKNSSLVDFSYTEQLENVDIYYNGYWPKNIARLRRTYFNSPWNAIALFAAFILFSLTVVQTVFTVLG